MKKINTVHIQPPQDFIHDMVILILSFSFKITSVFHIEELLFNVSDLIYFLELTILNKDGGLKKEWVVIKFYCLLYIKI